MRKKIATAAVAAAFVIGTFASPAQAVGAATPGVAVPGSFQFGYATTKLVTQVDGTLEFINADVQLHDIVSVAKQNPNNNQSPPLFQTDLISTGQVAEVKGLDRVVAGQTYKFFCSLHPSTMTGELTVVI